MARQSKKVTEDVEETVLSAPAVFSNWFVLTRLPFGFRLSLAERAKADGKLMMRGAYVLPLADALALRDLLNEALAAAPPARHH
jgi:hypothetical protein